MRDEYEHLTYRVPLEWMELLEVENQIKWGNLNKESKVYKDLLHIIKRRKMELHPEIVRRNPSLTYLNEK